MGKSAIIKSLYQTLGAEPHKVDSRWKRAHVASLLRISVDGVPFSVLRHSGVIAVFDDKDRRILETNSLSKLSEFWAGVLNVGLIVNDGDGNGAPPPPSYMFAPFYIDQDRGWSVTWSSFVGLGGVGTKQILAEYHMGLKSNEYFAARAERERLRAEAKRLDAQREGIHKALGTIKSALGKAEVLLDFKEFSDEVDGLVDEINGLSKKQWMHKKRLVEIHDQRNLWIEQRGIVGSALKELRGTLSQLVSLPAHVTCPTCGAVHENSIGSHFALVKDEDALMASSLQAKLKLSELSKTAEAERRQLAEIEDNIKRIEALLDHHHEGVTLRDIIQEKGREEARHALAEQLAAVDDSINELREAMSELTRAMSREVSHERLSQIKYDFSSALSDAAQKLDVVLPEEFRKDIILPALGRGSETPRALFAYYHAVLNTAARHSSAPFCPIVVDAPNQQGQDAPHIRAIMQFIFQEQPAGTQVIAAAESSYGFDLSAEEVVEVGKERRRVLDPTQYDEVLKHCRPYLGALL